MKWQADPDLPDSMTEEPVKMLVISLHDRPVWNSTGRVWNPGPGGKSPFFIRMSIIWNMWPTAFQRAMPSAFSAAF